MTKFYSIWAKQGNQYSSFREAQLELKKTFPEAVYWGAFVMYDK
jgi:CHAT domain-containing protein